MGCTTPKRRIGWVAVVSLGVVLGCGNDRRRDGADTGLTAGSASESDGAEGFGEEDDGAGDDGLLDVATADLPSGGGGNSCTVDNDIDGVGDCDQQAPPNSFEPAVQWEWWPETEVFSVITPLVANLTDDNGDGVINLCDTPDVVVVVTARLVNPPDPAHIWILDGATGQPHLQHPVAVKQNATPAIADLDDDGVPEIITAAFDHDGTPAHLMALSPDGTVKWESSDNFPGYWHGSAVAVADVDNDGDPEILYHDMLFDHHGHQLWKTENQLMLGDASTIADLDGDQDMEIVYGDMAVHHDGSLYYQTGLQPGYPAVADLDEDGLPEVLLTNRDGITLIEHDGTIKYQNQRPTGVEGEGLNWSRPATIHNFDGEAGPEFAMSSKDFYTVYEPDASIVWSAPVLDESGYAAGTAFDFLGDGIAEAMYADETTFFIFDGAGSPELTMPRASNTLHEYPVVADIDNDGSAEILVVTEERQTGGNGPSLPTVQAIRDVDDRWIQARRIWNQHTYHVTNVREDATIPAVEVPNWEELNTFRTNAQLDASGIVCQPPPPG